MKSKIVLPKLNPTRIALCMYKGGVGKSVTSTVIQHETENCLIVTNDSWAGHARKFNTEGRTLIKRLAPGEEAPEIPVQVPVVFDAGGYGDTRLNKALEEADVVLVPVVADNTTVDSMLTTLDQASQINNNIIIIVNKAKKGDSDLIKMVLESMTSHPHFSQYPIVEMSESKMFSRALNQGVSPTQQYRASGLASHWFSKPYQQIATLFETINNSVLEVA